MKKVDHINLRAPALPISQRLFKPFALLYETSHSYSNVGFWDSSFNNVGPVHIPQRVSWRRQIDNSQRAVVRSYL